MAYSNNDHQAMRKHLKGLGYEETKDPNVLVNKSSGIRAIQEGGSWKNNNGSKSTDIVHGKNTKKMW